MASLEHKQLMQRLTKLANKEKWQRYPKVKGKLIAKEITKTNNIALRIETRNEVKTVYVIKKNPNLYQMAQTLSLNATLHLTTRRYLGRLYALKITLSS